jgi:3-methyladenine DNA glycosylase AlkD
MARSILKYKISLPDNLNKVNPISKEYVMNEMKAVASLRAKGDAGRAKRSPVFFKHCKDDIFLGVPAAEIKKVAKEYEALSLVSLRALMQSDIHEARSLAHAVLRRQYLKADASQQEKIISFYLKGIKYIRDWDGVDDSAPYLLGAHLLERKRDILYDLVKSKNRWERRVAIVSTWWFIRHDDHADTLKIATLLLNDDEDLLHKATGWMLREVGKRDVTLLKKFLAKHAPSMPRTALRYAIERFSAKERAAYLKT